MIIRRANKRDNDQLLELIGLPIPGTISLAFTREPDYFAGAEVQTDDSEVWVCQDKRSDEIIGLIQIGMREVFWQGSFRSMRYICDLRVKPSHMKGSAFARLLLQVKKQFQNQVNLGFFYVFSDNDGMLEILRKRNNRTKDTWVLSREFAGLESYMIPIAKGKKDFKSHFYIISQNIRKEQWLNFTARIKYKELASGIPTFEELQEKDFFFAQNEQEEIIGCLQVVDTTSHKQTLVHGYQPMLNFFRPVINLFLNINGGVRLPAAGSNINYLYAHQVHILGGKVKVLEELIQAVRQKYDRKQYAYLLIGFHEIDPLKSAVNLFRGKRKIKGRACWLFIEETEVPELKATMAVEVARI